MTLSELKKGQSAVVEGLATGGDMRRRLQDIGFVEGTKTRCVGVSPLGDPSAFLVRGAVIALRSKDSATVRITRQMMD